MLRWLHQRLTRYKNNVHAFLFFTFFLHILFVWVIFFGYRQSIDFTFMINKSSSHALIKLLPLGEIKPKLNNGSFKNKDKSEILLDKKNKNKNEIKKKKTAILKEKKQKKISIKKNKSNQIKNNQINGENVDQKKEEISIKEAKSEVENVKKELIDEKMIQQPQEDVLYVTQKELDALQLEQQLKEAIEQVWVSPFGVESDLICEVLVVIGWDGTIIEKSLTKPSEIYIYDSAVEEALDKLIVPQQLWGKTITIIFKP